MGASPVTHVLPQDTAYLDACLPAYLHACLSACPPAKARLGLARACYLQPDLCLLDEPLAALDPG